MSALNRPMKPSGVDWIGDIPAYWKSVRCKYVSDFINGYAFPSSDFDTEGEYPVVRIGDIANGTIMYSSCLRVNDNAELGKYKIRIADILVAMSGATVGKVGIERYSREDLAYINQRVGIIRSEYPIFLFYVLSTDSFIEYISLMSNFSAQPNVSGETISNWSIPFPSVEEQQAIADYLDKKCAEIDRLVKDIEKQIDILERYKQSVISEAVTKGLDPTVPMKSSGIDWIGDIPSHWTRSKTKNNVSVLGSGTTPQSSNLDYYDGEVPWIQSGDIYGKAYIDDTSVNVTQEALQAFSALHVYTQPFIVVAMYGGSVGNMAISRIDACVNQACCCLKPNEDNNFRFFYYWLQSAKADFLVKATGGGQPNISQFIIRNQFYYSPPLAEQRAIADYLDEKCAEIDALIETKQEQLERLAEYKKSLIYEYVTGKKEVSR